jgi:hypothetical protein
LTCCRKTGEPYARHEGVEVEIAVALGIPHTEAPSARLVDAQEMAGAAAYRNLAARGLDECGLLEIASRTVGVPFVGVIAATLALMEIVRRLNHGPSLSVLDMTLRDIGAREGIAGKILKRFNPGYTILR